MMDPVLFQGLSFVECFTAKGARAQQTHWWKEEKQPDTIEKCYNSEDELNFVEGDDEMDFLCMGYKSRRARMSCGHTVTPTSLTEWCRRQLDEGSMKFVCGFPNCDAEWTYEEVCKMALLTQEENKYFEDTLFRNSANVTLNVKACPGCKCRVVRKDPDNLCVICPKCSSNSQPFIFCWQCLTKWKGPAPASYQCENDDCCYEKQRILENCPVKIFQQVTGINGCPCIRACPACGVLLEHSGQKCKFIVCRRCKVKFCFVCLKLFPECQNYYELCLSGVAPRQTL